MRISIKKKQEKVKELLKRLNNAKTIAVVNLNNINSNLLKKIRKTINANIIISSKNILKRLLEKYGNGYEKLVNELRGSCALLIPKEDIFKISVKLNDLSSPALIKEGTIAPLDIIIPQGPTPFMPGELMTMLTAHGVNVSPKGGKITIVEDAKILNAGEEVNEEVAYLLSKLNIKPIKIKLQLLAAFDGKNFFTQKELEVNVKEIMDNLVKAYSQAFNLSYNANIINSATIKLLLKKAYDEARNLAREAGIVLKDNVGEIMLNAKAKASALADTIKWEVKK